MTVHVPISSQICLFLHFLSVVMYVLEQLEHFLSCERYKIGYAMQIKIHVVYHDNNEKTRCVGTTRMSPP